MTNKLQEFYNASYPILRKVDNSINIEIINSLRANSLYIATTRYPKTTIEFDVVDLKNRLHPTQKPVALLEYLIKTYTQENEIVLDFTFGSCSTGVACLNTNRKFIGVEMNEGYFDVAKDRIEKVLNY